MAELAVAGDPLLDASTGEEVARISARGLDATIAEGADDLKAGTDRQSVAQIQNRRLAVM